MAKRIVQVLSVMVSSQAIQAMKHMALDPKKRTALIKDSACIGGLVLVLSNPDPGVVKLALETIQLLTESVDQRPVLRDFIGMIDQLESLIECKDVSTEIKSLARQLVQLLTDPGRKTPLRESGNTSRRTSRRSSIQRDLNCLHRASKTIILQLRGLLNKCDRDVCMRLLLQVKGVISITFDMNKKRCVLRTKLDVRPESLVHVIAKTQSICAQQVVKNDSGEELFLSFGHHLPNTDKENDSDLSGYLPDDEPVDEHALARTRKDSKGSSWLSSAANFLTNSFYW